VIDQAVIDHLLEFFVSQERKSKHKQILPNEPDKDLINYAARGHLVSRIKGTGNRTKGWRFTPIGRLLLVGVLKEKELKNTIKELQQRLDSAKEEAAPDIKKAKSYEASEKVALTAKQISPTAWMNIASLVEDKTVRVQIRTLYMSVIEYCRTEKGL